MKFFSREKFYEHSTFYKKKNVFYINLNIF